MYKLNKSFVLRDIGGIYFAVDITNKKLYEEKKIYTLNKIGYTLLRIAEKQETFSAETLVGDLIPLLCEELNPKQLINDVGEFLKDTLTKGITETYG